MKRHVFLSAAVLIATLVAAAVSGDTSPETAAAAAADGFNAARAQIPVTVSGKAADLRCEARADYGMPYQGWNRCPFDRVMSGAELRNGTLVITCSEIRVTCR